MATELSDVGMPLSEEQKVGRILMSLPKKFGHFHTSWQNVDSSKRTVQLLTTRLQTEEAFQDFKGLSVSDKDSALYSRSNKKRPNSKGTKSQVRFADEDTKPAHGGHRKSCAFCKRGGYKSSHREEDCYRKEAYIQGRRDAGDTAYAATSGTTKVTVSPPQQSDTSSDDGLAFMSNLPNSDKRGWYADSGSSTHMTDQRSLFDTFTAIQPGDRVVRGIGKDNKPLHALGIGEICIERKVNGRLITGKLYAVLYVPNLGVNLFSIGAATQHGVTATFQDNQVTLSKNGKVVAAGTRSNQKLYRLDIVASQFKNDTEDFAALSQDDDIQLWHKRLGHVNFQTIKRMKSKDMIDGMQLNPSSSEQPICEGCIMGKHHRLPFPKDGRTRATRVGELIHSDVCGPITPCSIGGSRYFVIFKDDYSCFSFIEFMKEKSEVRDHFKNFAARMKTLTGQPVVTLRSDNGGEFMSLEFSAWLQEHGIKHETSIARTPEQNGVSERENRTVVESARSMLLTSRLPKNMWVEAVGCAIYLLNRVPCRATPDATPFERFFNRKPDVSHLKVFGCDAYLHIPKEERSKFDSKSLKCHFVGYSDTQKGYRLWDPVHRKLKIGRDVKFDESYYYSARFLKPLALVPAVEDGEGGVVQTTTGRAAGSVSLAGETPVGNMQSSAECTAHPLPRQTSDHSESVDDLAEPRVEDRLVESPPSKKYA